MKVLPDKKLRTKANHGPRSNTINSPCSTDIRQSEALSNYLSPNEAHAHNNKNCMHLNIEYFNDDEVPSETSSTIHYQKKDNSSEQSRGQILGRRLILETKRLL